MADYTSSKEGLGKLYSENELHADYEDLEPLITPEMLVDIHLFGVNLVSNIKNQLTGKYDVMDAPKIKRFILEAVALGQAESKLDLFPKQYCEKIAFDRAEYDMFGYMVLRHRPVLSLESLTVTPSNEQPIFQIPNEWIDVGYLHQGQINLIPLTIAVRTGVVVPLTTSPGGATFLSIFGNKPWIPSFFEATYTTGFKNGLVPKVVNHYIGVIAAMEILSALAATYVRNTGSSLGIDGLSTSVSTPGGDLFASRLKDLADKRKWLKGRLQAEFNMNIITGNV
jgi:hypothetical protein